MRMIGLPHAPAGIVVAGSPIGSSDLVEAFSRGKTACGVQAQFFRISRWTSEDSFVVGICGSTVV
jgi:hypothetical protein